MTRWEWNSRRATAVTSRIVTAAIAMAICTVSWADYWQPVKAEIVEIGFSLPFYSAETRVVPGVAGIWTGAGAQVFVRDDILAKERAGTPDCAAPSITNTFVAAPDMIATHKNGRSTSHFLQTWTVDRCGTAVTYAVEYIEAPGQAVRVRIEPAAELFADAGTDMFYAKLKEAAAQRERDRASGDWADLNLPMPPGWHALVAMPFDEEPCQVCICDTGADGQELAIEDHDHGHRRRLAVVAAGAGRRGAEGCHERLPRGAGSGRGHACRWFVCLARR